MTGTTKARARFSRPLGALAFAAGAIPLACASSSSPSSGTGFGAGTDAGGTTTTTTKDSGAPTKTTTTDSGTDAAPTTTTEDAGGSAALALPFFVSDQFIPSGFMNDPTGITVSTGANGSASCATRAPGAGGDCYVISWASTGAAWAGVYWQYPSQNWGTEPGLVIAPGAKQVSFYAMGAVGGEQLTFKSGGINEPISAANGAYGDTFAVASPVVTLTTTWTQYTISLQGASYSEGVLGAFVWVASEVGDGGNENIKFYLDDLTWE